MADDADVAPIDEGATRAELFDGGRMIAQLRLEHLTIADLMVRPTAKRDAAAVEQDDDEAELR